MAEYDLYLDESGDFQETSTDSNEQDDSVTLHRHRARSQFAGLLARGGLIRSEQASKLLENIGAELGIRIRHGAEIQDRSVFNQIIGALTQSLQALQWQPVRLVNTERVVFGDRATTHINLLSEAVVRIFQHLESKHGESISLRVFPAAMYLGKTPEGDPDHIRDSEYALRLYEAIGYINVRRGYAYRASRWHLHEVKIGPGQGWPELILCDLISNASYANFRKLDSATKSQLKNAIGAFDFSMQVREIADRVRFLIDEGSIGMAIVAIAEHLAGDHEHKRSYPDAEYDLRRLIEAMESMPMRLRDPQLKQVVYWLEQIIDGRRDLNLGRTLIAWIRQNVLQPLSKSTKLSGRAIHWFEYHLATLSMTCCNHAGLLLEGAGEASTIQKLAPPLSRQWQHTGALSQGLIAVSVHKTDCMQFDEASDAMRKLVSCDEAIASLFANEMFDEDGKVTSDVRAQSLGTWLQSEIFAGKSDPARLDLARTLSERAFDEFTDPMDIERQYQYRCQLETAARQFSLAKEFFAKSLSLPPDTDHEGIAKTITDLVTHSPFAQGFALLHWFRLGTAALTLDRDSSFSKQFVSSVEGQKLLKCDWCTGIHTNYPAHGVLRRVAIFHALQDQKKQALATLSHYSRLAPGARNQLTLLIIAIVAVVEVAGLFWQNYESESRTLLEAKNGPALNRMLAQTKKLGIDKLPGIQRFLGDLTECVNQWISGSSDEDLHRRRAMEIARRVDY